MYDVSGLSYISEIMPSWSGEFSSISTFLSESLSDKSFQLSKVSVISGGFGGGLVYGS